MLVLSFLLIFSGSQVEMRNNVIYYENNLESRSRKILLVFMNGDFYKFWNLDGCCECFEVELCDLNLSVCIV